MKRWLALVFWGLLACVPAHADSGPPELQAAVKAWSKSADPDMKRTVVHVYVFMKPGAPLAAVFVDYVPEGGNHVFRDGMVFQHEASNWVPTGAGLEVLGDIVDGEAISPSKVIVHTKVLRPRDAACCPTGHKTWTVELTNPARAKAVAKPPAQMTVAQALAARFDWHIREITPAVTATALASDGRSHFAFLCDAKIPSINFTFDADGYRGRSFQENSGLDQSIVFEIRTASGATQEFPFIASPTGDGDWMSKNDLTGTEATAFLDAFGQDGRLSFKTAKGEELASWALKGTSQGRELMRKVCDL